MRSSTSAMISGFLKYPNKQPIKQGNCFKYRLKNIIEHFRHIILIPIKLIQLMSHIVGYKFAESIKHSKREISQDLREGLQIAWGRAKFNRSNVYITESFIPNTFTKGVRFDLYIIFIGLRLSIHQGFLYKV